MKSIQILINGEQRYYSTKEKYMKSTAFPELNAAGFRLRLSAHKRTGVLLQNFKITERESEIEIIEKETIPAPSWSKIVKPTFDSVIDALPEDIHTKIVEIDNFLRSFKPIKFKRIIDKNGGKITYLASDAGVSYVIMPHRNVMRHTFGSYLLWNSKDSLGKHNSEPLSDAFEKLAKEDTGFVNRILSYKTDCIGCHQGCICRVSYSVQGKMYSACHGKIEFKMILSEFDDVMRLIKVIGTM